MARKIIKKYYEKYDIEFIMELEEITDEFEFAFNNINKDQVKGNDAMIKLKKLERYLDELLKEAEIRKLQFRI